MWIDYCRSNLQNGVMSRLLVALNFTKYQFFKYNIFFLQLLWNL